MSVKGTVAICTYNGEARIGEVLTALSRQTLACAEWEVLVIDNASTDRTDKVVNHFIEQQIIGIWRMVREERPGLSFARARAAKEARGEVICFLDDDNIPKPNFVAAALNAFTEHPRAGVIGGKVLPRWETKPTTLAEIVAPFALAICDLGETAHRIAPLGGGIVGAGLCVRTDLLRKIYDKEETASQVSGRIGKNLMSGEDLTISVIARLFGWECWYVPALQIEHILPASRMEKKYLLRLYEGIGRGQFATRKCYDWKARSPFAWLIGLKDLLRWQIGQLSGSSTELLHPDPNIARDLHDLRQKLILGRAQQAIFWPR